MGYHTEAFIGVDTAKLRNAVAVAESGLNGQVYFYGEIDNTEAAMRKLIRKLESKYKKLTFCYEAGPTGYGLFRLIKELGHNCSVAAPSSFPANLVTASRPTVATRSTWPSCSGLDN